MIDEFLTSLGLSVKTVDVSVLDQSPIGEPAALEGLLHQLMSARPVLIHGFFEKAKVEEVLRELGRSWILEWFPCATYVQFPIRLAALQGIVEELTKKEARGSCGLPPVLPMQKIKQIHSVGFFNHQAAKLRKELKRYLAGNTVQAAESLPLQIRRVAELLDRAEFALGYGGLDVSILRKSLSRMNTLETLNLGNVEELYETLDDLLSQLYKGA